MSKDIRQHLNLINSSPNSQNFLRELEEARLPLQKGVVDRVRGSYAALMVVMDPTDFIRLTTHGEAEFQKIFSDEFADLDAYKAGTNPEYNKDQYGMPYLMVEYPSGRVTGHEGRHRAAMIAQAGGDKFPVALMFRTPNSFTVTWEWDNDEGEVQYGKEVFGTAEEAYALKDKLEQDRQDDTNPWYSRIQVTPSGGGTIKGQPDRSNPDQWQHAAWKPEDMPKQLIGQFNKSIVVPASRMKAGIIKGHTHYKG